jgi:hypothetical protein
MSKKTSELGNLTKPGYSVTHGIIKEEFDSHFIIKILTIYIYLRQTFIDRSAADSSTTVKNYCNRCFIFIV